MFYAIRAIDRLASPYYIKSHYEGWRFRSDLVQEMVNNGYLLMPDGTWRSPSGDAIHLIVEIE